MNSEAYFYKHVGKSSPIHDGRAKAAGALKYCGDLKLDNMHYGKLVYSTIPHGLVKEIHSEEAEKVPGVVKVLTCFNTTDRHYSRTVAFVREDTPRHEQIFSREVRFVGDRVALVIAKTIAAANEAARLIKVDYEELPAVCSVEAAMAEDAPKLHKAGNVYPVEGGFGTEPSTEGLIEITDSIDVGAQHHATLEPHVCIADYDRFQNKLTVLSPCQSVFAIRITLAEVFQIPDSHIRVQQWTMGGSFGCKQETILEPVAAAGAIAIGAPVRIALEREEVISSTVLRAPMHFKTRALVRPNGDISSLSLDCTLNAGAYLTNSQDYLSTMYGTSGRLYHFDHLKFTGRAVCTNTPISGSFRSWSSVELATAIEHLLDHIARSLGKDRLAVHRINALKPYDEWKTGAGTIGDCRVRECMEQGALDFCWEKEKTSCFEWNQSHSRIKKGVGMAAAAHTNNNWPFMDFATVSLKMNEDGSIAANVCLHDHGCGSLTANKKIIAETMDMEESRIFINRPDTDYNYYDYGCYGSRTVYLVGRATKNCAEKLVKELRSKAADMLGCPPDTLIHNGEGFDYGEGCRISFGEIVTYYIMERNEDTFAVEKYKAVDNPTASGVHFVKIAIDTLTGLSTIEKYYAIYDIGKAINPCMCRAQIGGAVQQALGSALTEEIIYDSRTGAVRNTNFNKYHLVNVPDMPSIDIRFVEHAGDNGPYSAKSIGELAVAPGPGAIVSAFEDALGRSVSSIPMTPVKTIELLKQAKGGNA